MLLSNKREQTTECPTMYINLKITTLSEKSQLPPKEYVS